MTRIVAGSAKGHRLSVPASGTRPTAERVREALFSRLEHRGYIEGCQVLDLYAGSGAFGLEAASRGATYVHLVESSPKASRIIASNIAATSLHAELSTAKVETWLAAPANRAFDLVFLDPPYALDEDALSCALAALEPHVQGDALVLVERDRRSPEPSWPPFLTREDERSWGDTRVWSAIVIEDKARLES